MPTEPQLYTAAQIAAALGTYKQLVRKRLGTAAGEVLVRGKAADAWTLAALPGEIRAELNSLRRQFAFASVEDLLANPPPLYRHPFNAAPAQVAEAVVWRDVLAPKLKVAASAASWVSIAESARASFAALNRCSAPSVSTALDRVKTAVERDAGWLRFERVELYLAGRRPAVAVRPDQGLRSAGERADTGAVADTFARLTGAAEGRAWHDLFTFWEKLSESRPSATVKRELMAELQQPGGLLYGLTGDAPRMRWRDRFKSWSEGGRTAEAAADKRRRDGNGIAPGGRAPKFVLSREEAAALRNWRLKKGSFALAVEWFVLDPACTPATRELIQEELDRAARLRREPSWPPSFRRAGHVTVDEEALFRSEKNFSGSVEFTDRRGLEWVDENGARLPLLPNTLWESDDMSSNEPFTWLDADQHGQVVRRIGRQTLCTIDVFSCNWLGVSPIGRERDAYRVEDIAEHMLDCVRANGLPTIWRLERGAWENNFIDGIPLADGTRWGGLDALMHIERAFKSRQKGTVESSFDLLQAMLAHESTSIGRVRGEFGAQTKLFLAAGRGDAAAWARFWPIEECADGFAHAMRAFNHRPKKRRAHGRNLVVPADLYRTAVKRELKAEDAWRFCPVKKEGTVRGGHVQLSATHYPLDFRFRVNGCEDGLYLEHGYRVLAAFHPGHPERGCHIFNAETGSLNRDGYRMGELIAVAPMAEDAPQVNLSPDERVMQGRKNANAAVRAEFRAIRAAGAPAIRSSTARNGWGDSARVEHGAEPIEYAGGRPKTNPDAEKLMAAARSARRAKRPELTPEEEEEMLHELRRSEEQMNVLPF